MLMRTTAAWMRPHLRLVSTRRSLHAEPTPSPPPPSSALPTPSPLQNGDINKIHLDMFFDRSLVPRTAPSSPPAQPMSFTRNTTTAATAINNELVPAVQEEQPYHHQDPHMEMIDNTTTSHHFDTYEQVTQLEAWGGFSRRQAKALMETLQHYIRLSVARQQETLLASSQLENETYLISAAVAEFRREVQLLRRNDSVLLQSELTALGREVDTLEQRLSEDLGSMRDEIELSMNDYRSDVREEQKVAEHHIQGINNRLTVMLGDTATELESLKMNVIWRGLLGGVLAALGISVVGYVLSAIRLRSLDRQSREKRKTQENDLSFADMEIS
ncbi:hypothetical protein O0I10_010042 [Lichtheimia ornata]|uniref:DUF1640-domain-containing protein n=1 Tax=Lichtheimia ornata TaxID=688661 RepID=A0AAD7UWQ6_9FUNG|nr:uncharacterized protein O0I10_010042 [Lichtheimia ornata]KAJ8654346.1 hypothetical protein O0I10_010042 [Lichtheimia ornata]